MRLEAAIDRAKGPLGHLSESELLEIQAVVEKHLDHGGLECGLAFRRITAELDVRRTDRSGSLQAAAAGRQHNDTLITLLFWASLAVITGLCYLFGVWYSSGSQAVPVNGGSRPPDITNLQIPPQ